MKRKGKAAAKTAAPSRARPRKNRGEGVGQRGPVPAVPITAKLVDDLMSLYASGDTLIEACRKHNVPSLSAAVVRSDGIVVAQCSGVRKRGTDDAVALSDRHPLGSCTKSMTATLAAVLVESGKIDWKTTISQVWPRADEKHVHPALRDVTLDELLSHQSGLVSDLSDLKDSKDGDWVSFFAESERARIPKDIPPSTVTAVRAIRVALPRRARRPAARIVFKWCIVSCQSVGVSSSASRRSPPCA